MVRFKEYVGTVTGISKRAATDDQPEFEYRGRWILYKFLWFRRAKLIGNPGNSSYAQNQKSLVHAWLKGGPLPELDDDTQVRKSAPVLKLVRNTDP